MVRRAQPSYDEALFRRADQGGHWHRWDVDPFVPQSVAPGVKAQACVSSGRWVIRCPFCTGAQLADPGRSSRFFCVDCLNASVGGQWVVVTWPPEVHEIEATLDPRPEPNQNWELGESVEDLQVENVAHGVA
jgi:hypothetical protein